MAILVTGGRTYALDWLVWRALDGEADPGTVIVQGGSPRGADYHARTWADAHGHPCVSVLAPWRYHGPKAGPLRNAWMLSLFKVDLVLAFTGGKGTQDMVERARAAGIPVVQYGLGDLISDDRHEPVGQVAADGEDGRAVSDERAPG